MRPSTRPSSRHEHHQVAVAARCTRGECNLRRSLVSLSTVSGTLGQISWQESARRDLSASSEFAFAVSGDVCHPLVIYGTVGCDQRASEPERTGAMIGTGSLSFDQASQHVEGMVLHHGVRTDRGTDRHRPALRAPQGCFVATRLVASRADLAASRSAIHVGSVRHPR